MIISGDESVAGQIRSTGDGGTGVELAFPERMVLVANHQVFKNSHPVLENVAASEQVLKNPKLSVVYRLAVPLVERLYVDNSCAR